MRKTVITSLFVLLGFISTWAGLFTSSRINYSAVLGDAHRIRNGCWELDHCDVPWWYLVLIVGVLLLPTLIHGTAGYRLAKRNASPSHFAIAAIVLLAATCLYYMFAALVSHYV